MIADDSRLVREGIASFVRGEGIEVVAEASTPEELIAAVDEHEPDVVVVNAGGARFTEGDPITMTADDIAAVAAHAPRARVVAVHLEADEPIRLDGFTHHVRHASVIALRMDEGETVKPIRPARDNARHLTIRHGIVGVKRREENGAVNPCGTRPAQIVFERGSGVPRSGKAVALSRVAVTIDDHGTAAIGFITGGLPYR